MLNIFSDTSLQIILKVSNFPLRYSQRNFNLEIMVKIVRSTCFTYTLLFPEFSLCLIQFKNHVEQSVSSRSKDTYRLNSKCQ